MGPFATTYLKVLVLLENGRGKDFCVAEKC